MHTLIGKTSASFMKKITLLLLTLFFFISMDAQPTRTIFITGGDFGTPFINYVIALTHKPNPRICYIPTASADNPYGITHWYELCSELPAKPFVLRTFLNSSPEQKTFEETILSMDAIIVGGGSTLNMIAIWKAQGIDTVLRKAYEKGIVMAGGSAGSLCWFTGGLTDSRPIKLSLVECLGFIQTSHCPHYHSEPTRRPLYQQAILTGMLGPGYACDDRAGILFQNEKLIKSVAADQNSHTYYVSVADGKIKEDQLPVEVMP
jgi:peptidase E